MKTLIKVLGISIMTLGMLVVADVASASVAETLQPTSTITYSEPVTISETLTVAKPGYFRQGVHIGSTEADVGGVTYFNGTIVNAALDSSGDDTIPVTFGDDVRVDGRLYRGATAGTSANDSMPVIVNDNMEVAGTLTVGGFSGSGVISTGDIASGAVTQTAESSGNPLATQSTIKTGNSYDVADTVTITTGNSTLFCMYSNLVSSDAFFQTTNMILYVDGQPVPHTYRRETTGQGEGQSSLAASALVNVTAGSHTVEVRWNTSAGTATMYAHALDVIELKK